MAAPRGLAVRPGPAHRGALLSAGTLLGAGLGGFVDGILLHQILQWHNLMSSQVPPVDLVTLKYNMLWDGLFHAFTWVMTVSGLALLWRSGRKVQAPLATLSLVGSMAFGWGLFNVVEGLIDHQLLGLHHVHPGSHQLGWDMGFILLGAALTAGGWTTIQYGQQGAMSRSAQPTAMRTG